MSVRVISGVTKWYECIVPWVQWHSNWGTQWIPEFYILAPGPGEEPSTLDYDLDYFDQKPSILAGCNDVVHCKVHGTVKVLGTIDPTNVNVTWVSNESPFPRVTVKDASGVVIWTGNAAILSGNSVSYVPEDQTYHRLTRIQLEWQGNELSAKVVIRDQWNQGFGWNEAIQETRTESCNPIHGNSLSSPVNWQYYKMDEYLLNHILELAESEGGLRPYSRMCLDAAQTARLLNINGIAYLKDALELVKFGASLAQGASGAAKSINKAMTFGKAALACKNGRAAWRYAKPALKDAASLYLGNHYGTKLTIGDTIEIADALDKLTPPQAEHWSQRVGNQDTGSIDWSFPVLRPHKISHVAFRRRVTMDLAAVDWESAWFLDKMSIAKRALYETDTAITWSNLWDMVPFSFVVDWFLPIGDEMEHLEKVGYQRSLPIKKVFLSTTSTFSVEFLPESGLEGKLNYRCYKRQCFNTPPPPPLYAEEGTPDFDGKHLIEGAALVAAMKL